MATELEKYNEELREKQRKKNKKTATRANQVTSAKPKLTSTEKLVGAFGDKLKKLKSELVGKKYDDSLKKRKKLQAALKR